jgi:hypothetical protein
MDRFASPGARKLIALLGLEVGGDRLQRAGEMVVELALPSVSEGMPFEAREEVGSNRLVAVNVHGEDGRVLVHGGENGEDFRAALERRGVPFAVEVDAGRVGAEVPADRAVGVHVGHAVEGAAAKERPGDGVVGVDEALERTFHPPARHALARMLAAVKPDSERALPKRQAVDRLAVEALPQLAMPHVRQGRQLGNEVVVPLHRIGCEIGDPQEIGFRSDADREHTVGVGGIGERPRVTVMRNARLIAGPAHRVGCAFAVDDAQRQRLAARTGKSEVKPLVEVAVLVGHDLQVDGGAFASHEADIAGIEGAADGDGHGGAL